MKSFYIYLGLSFRSGYFTVRRKSAGKKGGKEWCGGKIYHAKS